MSNENNPTCSSCFGYLGDYTTHLTCSYMGFITSHYKDPYETTNIVESKRVFLVARVSSLNESFL